MTASPLRLVFAGTPDFAAAHLEALISSRFQVVSAYSQPDRPSGRGKKVAPTPVKAVAEKHSIVVHQPLSLNDADSFAELAEYMPDVMVVVAYGLLLPPAVLALPTYGCLNVHTSLLPNWRGAAPIERAILAGDKETGVCVMQMDQGLDTGPVLRRVTTPIKEDDNAKTLTNRLQQLGCNALIEVLHALPSGALKAEPQNHALASYARKISKDEARIDWQRSAAEIHNQVRALYPRSPAWTLLGDKRLRVIRSQPKASHGNHSPGCVIAVDDTSLTIACGNGVLQILELQMEGKGAMSVAALHNGNPDLLKTGLQF